LGRKSSYSEGFREEALLKLKACEGRLSEAARSLGITPDTLRFWRNQEEKRSRGAQASSETPELELEVRRLRRQVASLEKDKELLKKVLAIFSETPR
jgi:transposase